ncbi:hypothetical protein HIM_09674 [Hirsutella minnesotensis 3608]|uniref:EH domain-containing protein n=1 Tax=Hirsutella minnesotensis 3608 TaxID=1043627 RepID=A0A0F7ZS85_9HYPO|nr:hypothetical protein HIM_09674 [Hirsutella minnesotensis 3608]
MIRTAASSGHPDDAAAAALRGASLAFQKRSSVTSPSSSPASNSHLSSPPSPPLSHLGRSRDNDARTAALTVGAGNKSRSPSRAAASEPRSRTSSSSSSPAIGSGSFNTHTGLIAPRLQQLHPPPAKLDPKSASFIAATLAASRSASPSPKNAAVQRKSSLGAMSQLSGSDNAVDAAPIAPTGSLISFFDKSKTEPGSQKRPSTGAEHTLHDAQEAQHMAVHRFMAAPPRTLPKPPRPPTPTAPIVQRPVVKSSPVTVPRQPPTPPPIESHETPMSSRREPRQVQRSPVVSAESKPRPKPKVPANKPAQPDSPPVSRPPRPRAAKPPSDSLTKCDVKTPEKPTEKSPPKPTPPTPSTPTVTRPMTPPSIIRSTPEVLSPKPVRIARPLLSPTTASASPQATAPTLAPRSPCFPSPDPQKRSPESQKQRRPAPTPPKPRVSQRLASNQDASPKDKNPGVANGSRSKSSTDVKGNATSVVRRAQPSNTLQTMSQPPPLPRRRKSLVGAPPSPPLDLGRRHPANMSTSNLGLDSLTSAIMAGSLASSRLTPQNTGASLSPALSIPPLSSMPKRQKSPHMLQTLRQPHTHLSDEAEDRSKIHRHKLRGGKHKHHEGSRKRWREAMTPAERKRYEAVWASNRGRLLAKGRHSPGPDGDNSECVANVVVREMWKRSRLPEDELAEVWDLVDRSRRGMLCRPEFVVGMWLIDQRLRGRKLPHKVSDSLWGSAHGVTVLKPKHK